MCRVYANEEYQEFLPFVLDSTHGKVDKNNKLLLPALTDHKISRQRSIQSIRSVFVGEGKQCRETNTKTKYFSCGIIRFKGVKSYQVHMTKTLY